MNSQLNKTQSNHSGDSELRAINRKRMWIIVSSILAVIIMIFAFLEVPESAVIIVTVVILISLKKAAISYGILGKKKEELTGR